MNEHLSVLYYCGNWGLDLTKGEGYRVHVLKILESLKEQRHRPFLLTVNDNPTLPDFEDYRCVPHRYMRGVHHLLPYTGTLDSFHMYRAAVQLNQTRRFDVIHERFGLYSYGGILTSRALGIPVVLEVNGPTIEERSLFTNPITGTQLIAARTIRNLCARYASRIIVVSNTLKQFLLKHWKGVTDEKIVVMPNAADVERLGSPGDSSVLRRDLGLQDAFVIGFLGTFQAWYGLENLIAAMPKVAQRLPNARLLMVGDGHIRAQLEQQVEELNLKDVVRFTGYVAHTDVPRYLSLFDVAVAAFRDLGIDFCGSPIKLFEYMAAGRPIVASRIGQIPEIVTHEETAILVEPGDVDDLADAVVRLAGAPALRERLGAAARAEGRQYSWEAYATRLVEIYHTALAEQPSHADRVTHGGT